MAQLADPCFDAATFEIWGTLVHGAALIAIDRETALSPKELAAELIDQGITTLFLTTALFNQIAAEAPGAFRGLKQLLFGGEAANPKRVRRVLEDHPPERLLHVYGPTETTTFASWRLVTHLPANARTVPIGRPIANTRINLLDWQLEPAPVGVPGEIYIGGARRGARLSSSAGVDQGPVHSRSIHSSAGGQTVPNWRLGAISHGRLHRVPRTPGRAGQDPGFPG
jgi:non-ribosomal peptide synthetase component F